MNPKLVRLLDGAVLLLTYRLSLFFAGLVNMELKEAWGGSTAMRVVPLAIAGSLLLWGVGMRLYFRATEHAPAKAKGKGRPTPKAKRKKVASRHG